MERLHGCITGQRAEHALVFCLLVHAPPTEMHDDGYVNESGIPLIVPLPYVYRPNGVAGI